MRKLFAKWRKARPERPPPSGPAPVDSDETVVIDLSAEERFAPDEVRVEFEPGADKPEAPRRQAAAPPPRDGATSADDERTRIWTAADIASPHPDAPTAADPRDAAASSASASAPPPAAIDVGLAAGLLILTEGPQRGRIFAVNLGRNRIGRGPDNDIILDTGDTAISKAAHLVIAADPKNRCYFAVPGDSTNLAYLDEQPLLESREIADKAVIQLGATKLVFIQLFGNYLEWR